MMCRVGVQSQAAPQPLEILPNGEPGLASTHVMLDAQESLVLLGMLGKASLHLLQVQLRCAWPKAKYRDNGVRASLRNLS